MPCVRSGAHFTRSGASSSAARVPLRAKLRCDRRRSNEDGAMDDRHDFGNEAAGDVSSGQYAGTATRIGLDVGTSKVVTAQGDSRASQAAAQLNASIGVG